jgi:site-specific recombinase XerD
MKPFESFLAAQLNEYLTYRQGLGYTLMPTRANLLLFDRYLKRRQADWTSFEPAFFLEMTARLDTESRTVNRIVSSVRVFFRFLVRCGYLAENPLKHIPPLKENTIVPFVFSPEQVDHFLEVICTKIRKTKGRFLKDFSLYLSLLLLARCGMRISEPCPKLSRPRSNTIYRRAKPYGVMTTTPIFLPAVGKTLSTISKCATCSITS